MCNGERVVILGEQQVQRLSLYSSNSGCRAGPPEEAEASGTARSSDLFVLVRLDSGSIGYINMR